MTYFHVLIWHLSLHKPLYLNYHLYSLSRGNIFAPPDSDYYYEKRHDRNYSDKPSQSGTPLSTDKALNGIESQLSSMQESVRTMRGIKNPREAQQRLMREISDTEKKLAYLKQRLQPQEVICIHRLCIYLKLTFTL